METKCTHYQRNCSVQAPCCGLFYSCKLCHDEQFVFKKGCQVDRMKPEDVKLLKCTSCQLEQSPADKCSGCGVVFGEFFCLPCRLFENNPDKVNEIFHCDLCKMCRRGKRENFTHCQTCGYCVPNEPEGHKCIPDKALSQCPVCLQTLHFSTKDYISLKCGHLIHCACWSELEDINCPTCGMAAVKMAKQSTRRLDRQIRQTRRRLPVQLRNKKVDIMCNECLHKTLQAPFHFYGIKCEECGTYNTKII